MQAVADALSLLANTVMAWNTMQMQAVVNRRTNRRQLIEADIMAKIAPTRLSGINQRGNIPISSGAICGRSDAVTGGTDNRRHWLKPVTV